MVVKVLTLNVKGLRNDVKRRAMFNYCRSRADIICLQETHSEITDEHKWHLEWGAPIIFSHGKTNSKGVCIMFRKGIDFKKQFEENGRVVSCSYECDNKTINLVNIYAPNEDDPRFFAKLMEKFALMENVIIMGDFNLTLNNKIDRRGVGINNDKAAQVVKYSMEEFNLKDVWRERNENVFRRTFYRKKPTYAASRIDFCLAASSVDQYIMSAFYIPAPMTDHAAMFISTGFENSVRGTGYWKFNDSLLEKEEFLRDTRTFIQNKELEYNEMNKREKWEIIKFECANWAQQWSREHANERKLILSQLYEKVDELEQELSDQYSEMKQDLLERSKQDIKDIEFEHAKGVIFRTRARWQVEAERNTAYFYGLEKSKYNAKTCSVLVTEKGETIRNQKQILEHQHKFYQTLYKKDPTVKFTIKNNSQKKLTEVQRELLDKEIEIEEISNALKQMKKGKTPGSDGLTVAWYKCFWDLIKQTVFEAICEGIQQKELHSSARRGIITLIPKAQKDPRKLKNLRPISLLNIDFKLLEKVLANRIKLVIDELISKDQKGFMAGRRITVNIRKVLDLIYKAIEDDSEHVLVSIDFTKCFDLISFDAIFGALRYFGFGDKFVKMVKVGYTNFTAVVQEQWVFFTTN